MSISVDGGLLAPRDLERFRSAAPSPASIEGFDFEGRDDVSEASFAAVIATVRDTAGARGPELRTALKTDQVGGERPVVNKRKSHAVTRAESRDHLVVGPSTAGLSVVPSFHVLCRKAGRLFSGGGGLDGRALHPVWLRMFSVLKNAISIFLQWCAAKTRIPGA